MKKLMMMAMMLVASAAAFAGDSDALKAILKAKTYVQAEELLNSSLSQLANAQEKARAYNHLVDLAMGDYNKQSTIVTENQLAKQMGQEEKPVDNDLMTISAYRALSMAIECDKYDQQPNEKGKLKPAFDKKNAERLWFGPRNQLVNSGQDALLAKDQATARKYWQLFAESDVAPLFKDCNREQQKAYFGQVTRFAAIFAYQDKDMTKALELCEIAMQDPEERENCINLKMEILGSELKTPEDTVNYIQKLEQIYVNDKTDAVMEKLYNMYNAVNKKEAADKLLDDALAANPNNFVALADKGIALLNENPAEAAKYLKRAVEVKPENAALQTFAGTALSIQAQNTEDAAEKKALYTEAIKYYDKAKELDPDRLNSNWGYNRYNAYYNLYGPDAPETAQAEADSK